MKKVSLRVVLFVLLFMASISAQIFINHKATTPISECTTTTYENDSSTVNPVSLDVEILKILLKHSKNHLPVISSSTYLD